MLIISSLLLLALQACDQSKSKVTYLNATFDDQPPTNARIIALAGSPDGDTIKISQNAFYSFAPGHPNNGAQGKLLRFASNNSGEDQTIDLVANPISDPTTPLLIQMWMRKGFNPVNQQRSMYIQLILDNGEVMAELVLGGANDNIALSEPIDRSLLSDSITLGPGFGKHKLTILADPENGYFFAGIDDGSFGAPVVYRSRIECTPVGQSSPTICHRLERIRFLHKNEVGYATTFQVDDVIIESVTDSDIP